MSDLPVDMYKTNKRKPLTRHQKSKMFLAAGGICCVCGLKIDGAREAWDEHILPLADGGTNDMENRAPAHERCAKDKTRKESTSRAKGRSAGMKHLGVKKQRRGPPMPGSRASPYKKKVGGGVVRRSEE